MWKQIIHLSFLAHCGLCQVITPLTNAVIPSLVSATWDDSTQSVYFTSLNTTGQQSSIFRYSYNDGGLYSAYIVGVDSPAFILRATAKCSHCNDLFIVGVGNQILTIKWDGFSPQAIVINSVLTLDANIPSSRVGTVAISPAGHLFGGTYVSPLFCSAPPILNYYRFEKKRGLVRLFGNLITTTGIAGNANTRKMYHLDSCQLLLTEFDIDTRTGDICNGRVAFDFKAIGGGVNINNYPLGLDVDTNGLVYTAQPQSIWVIDPRTSTLVRTIDFPAPVLNGLAFGGPNRDILYVIAAPNYNNPFQLSDVIAFTNTTTSLYAVTGLGAAGFPSSQFPIDQLKIKNIS